MSRVLFIDTETGGLDPEVHSLLSVGLVVWDNGTIKESKEILLKEGSLGYQVCARAMEINKIDLVELNKNGIPPEDAYEEIIDFCKFYFPEDELVTLGGHNTSFDLSFLKKLFEDSGGDVQDVFNCRIKIDTGSILKFLSHARVLPDVEYSLSKACKMFGIVNPHIHSAVNDAMTTAKVYNKLLDIMNNNLVV
jgi:DNA polymerase-3 subunit epsilon